MPRLHFHPFPELKSNRLLLRQLTAEDAQEIFLLRSDEKVNEFLDRPKATCIDDATKFIDKINTGIGNNECIYWAIVLKNERRLAGTICFWNIEKEKSKAEIGYELLPACQGKGIIQEAIQVVLDYGFSVMQLQVIDASLHQHNLRSVKILEKSNFRRNREAEKKIQGNEESRNIIVYSLMKQVSTMNFRQAEVKDIPQIQIVRNSVKENMLSDPALVSDRDVEDYITRRGKGWVCEVDNTIVGFAIVSVIDQNIWALFVDPGFEGRGIGLKLHDMMLDWYFNQTTETVWLGTSPGTRAEKFYRAAGWQEAGLHGKGEIKFEMTATQWKNR